MPAYIDTRASDVPDDWDAAGVKWVSVHLDNPEGHDLPMMMETIIYSGSGTAFPLAVMDGTELTRHRISAAAVATDYLAGHRRHGRPVVHPIGDHR